MLEKYPHKVYTAESRTNTRWGFLIQKGGIVVDDSLVIDENVTGKVCPACTHKLKERTEKEKRSMINRLNRIEGQVRGIRKMVEGNAYCPEILIQVSAVNAALNSFNKVLLAEHIRSCVAEDIRAGKEETIDELVVVLQKLMK